MLGAVPAALLLVAAIVAVWALTWQAVVLLRRVIGTGASPPGTTSSAAPA